MRIKRIVQGGISALVMGAFVVAMAPGSAQAVDWDHGPMLSGDGGDKATKAYFEERGDHLKVCDIDSDGKAARVWVSDYTTEDVLYTITDTKNDGKCTYAHASDGGKRNLPEHHDIRFVVGYAPYEWPAPRSQEYIYFNDH